MALLNSDFCKKNDASVLTDEEKIAAYYVYKNTPLEDYNDIIMDDGRYFVKYNFSDYRQSILRWYPFKKNASVLEINAEYGAVTGALCDNCSNVIVTEPSFFKAKLICDRYAARENLTVYAGDYKDIKFDRKFDYIVFFKTLEYSSDPIETLNFLHGLLNSDGVLLLECENQFGAQYLAGKKDPYSGVSFEGLDDWRSRNNFGRGYDRFSLNYFIENSAFAHWKFYYPVPDFAFARAIYTDAELPKRSLLEERLSMFHQDVSSFVCDDRIILVHSAMNNAFPFVTNSFIVELTNDKELLASATSMTLSGGYRNRKKTFAVILNGKECVRKKCLYPEGKEYAEFLFKINKELSSRGLLTLPMVLKDDSLFMDFVSAPTVKDYLMSLIHSLAPKETVYKVFDALWNDILRSSDLSEKNESFFAVDGIGPVLKNAYLEMVILNAFWINESIMYFDQEYVREDIPAKYVLFRSIRFLFGDQANISGIYERGELLKRFNISDAMCDLFMRWESELCLSENPYQAACVRQSDPAITLENRLKLSGK